MKTMKDKIETIEKTIELFCHSYEIENIELPMEKRLKNQTYFLNHGSSLSWMIVPSVLGKECYDKGFKDFKLGVIYHPIIKKIPFLNKLASDLAGTMPKTHIEVIKNLKRGHVDAYGTMPEAINCLFKWKDPIGPFKYNGLILAALEAQSDMFLIIHKGTENWDKIPMGVKQLPLPFHPQIPLPYKKLDLKIIIVPYKPSITLEDYKEYHKKYRNIINKDHSILDEEGVRMRRVMLEHYKNI